VDSAAIATDTIVAADIAANAVGDSEIAAHTTTKITVNRTQMQTGTQGGVLVYGASGAATDIGAGTNGQFLKSGGAGATAAWANLTGDWAQLGETVLGSSVGSISVSDFAARQDLRIVFMVDSGGTDGASVGVQFNSDTGSNYGFRYSKDLGAMTTSGSATQITLGIDPRNLSYIVFDVLNHSNDSKLIQFHGVDTSSDTLTTPTHTTGSGMWADTSAQITTVTLRVNSPGAFAAGSRVTVYGKKD